MSRPNPLVLTAGCLVFVVIFGALPLLKGGLYLDTHDGDSYHLLDILLRIEAGMQPHQDFRTPLGFLGFLPITSFMNQGFEVGMATILGQLGVGLALLPLVIYVGWSRLTPWLALVFGFLTLGIALSLSFGGDGKGVSISMHYNRWSWSIAFVAIALAMLPSRSERPWLDGTMIGVLGMVLALIKITYFVALAPAAVVAVALRWKTRGLVAVVVGAALVAIWVTATQGLAFWSAYLSDLILVSDNEVRPTVGLSLSDAIAGIPFLGATLVGVASLFLIRRTEHFAAAQAILLLVPGLIYVTYQNFGNEPLWLWLLGILVLALRPHDDERTLAGMNVRALMTTVGIICFALNFSSVMSHGTSTVRHAMYDESRFLPMLPGHTGHQDIFIRNDRAHMMTAQVHLDRQTQRWSQYADKIDRPETPEFQGVQFPYCQFSAGSRAILEQYAQDLQLAGLSSDDQVFLADNLTGLWMFGPFKPLERGAPWYYGKLTGVENADFVVLPKCGFITRIRNIVMRELEEAGTPLTLVRDNDLFAVFRVDL